MKKRFISIICCFALLLQFVLFVKPVKAANAVENDDRVQQIIYDYLTVELGLCPAAAVGIMGNVMIECGFDPAAKAIDTNNLYSFGLMMWNGPRYESLKKWCSDNGFASEDPRGQLGYLKWELNNTEKSAYKAMLNIPNTIEGACKAAIEWADKFERCTKTSYGLRIYYALNLYWPKYAGGSVSNTEGIFGYYYNVPENIKYKEPLTLYGAVVSYSSPIETIVVGVYDADSGELITGHSMNQSAFVSNIGVLDRFVVFNKLPRGKYYYTITAVNASGEYIVDKHEFTVSDEVTKNKLIYESCGNIICPLGVACPGLAFGDMPAVNTWAHEGIDYVVNAGLFSGLPGGLFGPDDDMSRAMLATVLWRLNANRDRSEVCSEVLDEVVETNKKTRCIDCNCGCECCKPTGDPVVPDEQEPSDDEAQGFDDVAVDQWFTDAVLWVSEEKLMIGTAPGVFSPDDSVTRGELAVLLYRFAEHCGIDVSERVDFGEFIDADCVPEWGADALSWALAVGLLNGYNDCGVKSINASDVATRAQVATIIYRFIEKF